MCSAAFDGSRVPQAGIGFLKNRPAYAIGSVDSALLLATPAPAGGRDAGHDVAAPSGSRCRPPIGCSGCSSTATSPQLTDRRYGPRPRGAGGSAAIRSPRCVRSPCRICARSSRRWGRRPTSWCSPAPTSASSRHRATRCCASATAPDAAGRLGAVRRLASLPREGLAALLWTPSTRVPRPPPAEGTGARAGTPENSRSTTRETEAGLSAVGVAVPPAGGFSGVALSVSAPGCALSADQSGELGGGAHGRGHGHPPAPSLRSDGGSRPIGNQALSCALTPSRSPSMGSLRITRRSNGHATGTAHHWVPRRYDPYRGCRFRAGSAGRLGLAAQGPGPARPPLRPAGPPGGAPRRPRPIEGRRWPPRPAREGLRPPRGSSAASAPRRRLLGAGADRP